MKYSVVFLAAILFLGSLGFPAYGEVNNPYPPPPQTDGVTTGATSRIVPGPTGSEILADLILVRPVSLLAYLFGTAMSVVAAPFVLSTPEKDGPETCYKLLNEPFDFAVFRPLGEFPEPKY